MTTFVVGDPNSTPGDGNVLAYNDGKYVPVPQVDVSNFVEDDDPRLKDDRDPTEHSHGIAGVTGLQAALDGKADSDAIPDVDSFITANDLNGYATESFVNNAVEGLATEGYVDDAINGIPAPPDLSGYVTVQALTDGLSEKADASALAALEARIAAIENPAE